MIVLENLTKIFSMHGHRKVVADNLNVTFPTGVSIGLVGANGAGKSTLLKLIAGTSSPTRGRVLSTGSVSFPVGLASSLHGDLTGAQNTRFVARIYGADTEALMGWVEEFAELGEHFHLPVRSYSSGMKGRLSFGINMGLAFDTYLIDEITAVGDAAFKRKSSQVFRARMESAGAIYVTHSMGALRELCQAGAMLEGGRLHYYDDVEEAIERYMVSLDPDRAHPVRAVAGDRPATRFPDDARMLYVMGLPSTLSNDVVASLRRFRPCQFAPTQMTHYFDVRAGRSDLLFLHRTQSLEELGKRFSRETPDMRSKTLRLMNKIGDLLQIHAAPRSGPGRHDTYVDYLLTRFSGQSIICDPTPDYALLGEADFTEMAQIGDASFCVTLRDPVDRLWESICTEMPQNERTSEACLAAVSDLLEAGPQKTLARQPYANYTRLMKVLDASVAKARQIVLFHERLADPATREAELARITDAFEQPEIPAGRRAEISPPPKMPDLPEDLAADLADLLAPQYAAMRARFGDTLPREWRSPGPAERALAMAEAPPELQKAG